MHERLPLRALLKVFATDAFANGRAHDLCLQDKEKLNQKGKNKKDFFFFLNETPARLLRRRYANLIALAVVLQAARPLAVAAFAVPAVRLALFAFANFRFEGLWVSVQAGL